MLESLVFLEYPCKLCLRSLNKILYKIFLPGLTFKAVLINNNFDSNTLRIFLHSGFWSTLTKKERKCFYPALFSSCHLIRYVHWLKVKIKGNCHHETFTTFKNSFGYHASDSTIEWLADLWNLSVQFLFLAGVINRRKPNCWQNNQSREMWPILKFIHFKILFVF